jgi:large subunit ribosomal protein L34e
MNEGAKKSNRVRRLVRKTPGRRNVFHYEHKGPSKAVCAKCGAILHGVASERSYRMRQLSKTEKRPSRPYGGVLCSSCMRQLQKAKARQ